ncbi:MAG: Endonuclease/Exonuclease/phosphatase family [Verrucomicrobiota bacterium]
MQWFPGRRPNASRWEEDRQIRSLHRDIAQVDSDLVAFEEVRNFEQAAVAVKPLPGFKVDVCSNFPAREGQVETQQVAITSRLQPLAAWAESWKPRSAITPPRGFAFAAYEIAPRQILLVYALHLKSNRGEIHEDMRIREESMNQLLAHTKAMKAAYEKLGSLTWIIGGDFNTAPDDPRFTREKTVPALLAQDFRWAWDGVPFRSRITVPADERYPAASFDQVFYRGGALTKAWLVGTSPQSSDHRAVSVMLSLK